MADHYTQFSTLIGHLKKREEKWLEEFLRPPTLELEDDALLKKWMADRGHPYKELDEEPEFWPHFDWEFGTQGKGRCPRYLWIYSTEAGNVDFVGYVVQEFLQKFRSNQCFSMEWASTCSKPLADGFGGGAIFVTADEVKYITTSSWVDGELSFFNGKAVNCA